ncbi:MAG: prepilin-type N-terminal cleavage/methylation domain-containing protein [Acaryochloris sp. RU_4_1]|nr:prepilin-type N-terminal cleavage/methylation domain-containing protein [Acaryochloris sp. SU_5_25]NJM65686.1 prepilin-type N-terminal cleavage/methylation domain-containing protein [Acaryochloris sp. RU_4_1]NJR54550.1 prepilin-type N-terminal cleavage/methylation domain-containing protein [Acaryochloris sp. CRU_2_0]
MSLVDSARSRVARITPIQLQHNRLGFSLVEILVVVAILGMMATLAAPSFLSWVNNKRIEDISAQVIGVLKEAQAEAIRKSQSCRLTITTTSVTASPPSCLPTGTRDLTQVSGGESASGVTLIAQATPITIQFSPKGSTTSSNVLVFYHPDQAQGMRCLAISSGIGLMRTGKFSGSHPPSTSQANTNNCHTSM